MKVSHNIIFRRCVEPVSYHSAKVVPWQCICIATSTSPLVLSLDINIHNNNFPYVLIRHYNHFKIFLSFPEPTLSREFRELQFGASCYSSLLELEILVVIVVRRMLVIVLWVGIWVVILCMYGMLLCLSLHENLI
jgi:hypothetical protein